MNLKQSVFLLSFIFICPALYAAEAVTLTTEDSWNLAASYSSSKNGKAVILLHDIDKSKADFTSFEQKLAEAGYGYLAIDMRGHGGSTGLGVQKDFKKTGTDNEFNQMVRDVNSGVAFLSAKGIPVSNIYLLGEGLGANVAAKSLIFNKDAAGLVLLTPSLKTRDVLTMNGLKLYKNPVLIAVSAEDKKAFMEASFIRNAAFLGSGEGKVTFLTAYDKSGAEMMDKYLTYSVLQWLDTPALPEIKPDAVSVEETPITIEGGDAVLPAQGEEEPIVLPPPSVLPKANPAPQQKPTATNTVAAGSFDIL